MSYVARFYHIVYSTKDRRPFLRNIMSDLVKYTGGIFHKIGGSLIEANGPADHLHLVAVPPLAMAIPDVMRNVKASSSKCIHQTFPDLHDFAWQVKYAAFTVSRSQVPVVEAYVRNQVEHHRKRTFEEELMALLKAHGVEYNPRYLLE